MVMTIERDDDVPESRLALSLQLRNGNIHAHAKELGIERNTDKTYTRRDAEQIARRAIMAQVLKSLAPRMYTFIEKQAKEPERGLARQNAKELIESIHTTTSQLLDEWRKANK